MPYDAPSRLTDDRLIAELERLAGCEREATSRLVAHLAEFDARRLYRGAGFPSLFIYCCEVLHLSEHGAYNRIEAARAARRFPAILDMLERGTINLATIRLVAPHLTADNHQEVLAAAAGRGKRHVEELLARMFPRPDVAPLIRRCPSPVLPAPLPAAADTSPERDAAAPPAAAPQPAPFAPRRALPASTPLAPGRYAIRFTASAETWQKFERARDLLRHVIPDGDIADVFDRALTVLLADLEKKKLALVDRPKDSPTDVAAGSRHIPAEVRRAVWRRDEGRCAFTAGSGRRCGESGFLEFHHVKPFAVGGAATVDNIQLRCRAHNGYESDLFYGTVVRETWRADGSGRGWNSPRGELSTCHSG